MTTSIVSSEKRVFSTATLAVRAVMALSTLLTGSSAPVTSDTGWTAALDEVYPCFLAGNPSIGFSHEVRNTVFHQAHSNSSLDFTWMDMLRYDFHIAEDAEEFLKNYDYVNVLLDAKNHIRRYFPDEVLLLKLAASAEGDDNRLLLYIETDLSVEEASAKLDQLDEDWILDHMEELHGILIDVMFI